MAQDFRETLYTINKKGERVWVYPAVVRGFFSRARTGVVLVLMAIYVLMPWIEVGGHQGVLFDIANRKFAFLGTVFWATDTRFVALILGALAISLFFFTALFGRVWCGWACPETVFLEFLFRPIETLIEGNPGARKRLDAGPWNVEKIFKKGLKLAIYLVVAWFLASTALAYFVGRERLLEMMTHLPTENLSTFLVTLFLMAILTFQFGWFREQFCTIVCPYARFQSVLLDPDSLLVGYDPGRGEPRAKLRKGEPSGGEAGDCIDCGLCVRVCPTGIDIRNGLQLECVQCASCIDACNSVMKSIGRPAWLIRYDTENGLDGKRRRIVRPRVVAYALILCVYAAAFTYFLSTRKLTDFQVLRGSGDVPYSRMADGKVSNHLSVKIANKSDKDLRYTISTEESDRVSLVAPVNPFPVKAGQMGISPIFVSFKQALLKGGKLPLVVKISDGEGYSDSAQVTLLGPDE